MYPESSNECINDEWLVPSRQKASLMQGKGQHGSNHQSKADCRLFHAVDFLHQPQAGKQLHPEPGDEEFYFKARSPGQSGSGKLV